MEIISFLSLLLGLIVGEYDVELMVSEQVASVDVLLDGELVETLDAEPWWARCDFGEELRPHLLVAVARDTGGEELARVQQWINLPRGHAEARLLLAGDPNDGDSRVARLSWQCIHGNEPVSVTVSFDGKQLSTDISHSFALPPHDPHLPHWVTAELDFGSAGRTVAEVSFGGVFGEQMRTELTAVPVELINGRSLPDPEKLTGWFVKNGTPLEVRRIEKGEADLVLIMDAASRLRLYEMFQDCVTPVQTVRRDREKGHYHIGEYYAGPNVRLRPEENIWDMSAVPETREQDKDTYYVFAQRPVSRARLEPSSNERTEFAFGQGADFFQLLFQGQDQLPGAPGESVADQSDLAGDSWLDSFWPDETDADDRASDPSPYLPGQYDALPAPLPQRPTDTADINDTANTVDSVGSPATSRSAERPRWVRVPRFPGDRVEHILEYQPLQQESIEQLSQGAERLADAVASAGVAAAARGRRRAVVLVMSGTGPDSSRLSPHNARQYLEQLHVPFAIWTIAKKPGPAQSPWGEVQYLEDLDAVARAIRDQLDTLARQRVVWLRGAYLPQEIEISDHARQIRLAR